MSPSAASPFRTASILALVALASAAVWAGLTGMDKGALWIGAPTVALTTLAAARAGLPAMAPRIAGLPAFAAAYLVELGRSAVDLALRLSRRDPDFTPGLVAYRVRLRGEGARAALMNAVSLTPGSLSVSLRGEWLIVHSLDGDRPDVREALTRLENLVAHLYGEAA
jgi:multisubunit Na+/H+ antiporter MnhE subunit